MKAFTITKNGKEFDYRTGKSLDLSKVEEHFSKQYRVRQLKNYGRHVTALLEKDGKNFFLKLATTEGISLVCRNEREWDSAFNRAYSSLGLPYRVPRVIDEGMYDQNLFYIITEYFDGPLLWRIQQEGNASAKLLPSFERVLTFSEHIQNMRCYTPFGPFDPNEENPLAWFLAKVRSWYDGVPSSIADAYTMEPLLSFVEGGIPSLKIKPRHGDFTPWHIIELGESVLGLIDGEHAMSHGVEYYDICYYIQRVFTVLKNPEAAKSMTRALVERGYEAEKLQTVLAARAIGGYLDESLGPKPDYTFAKKFHDYIVSVTPSPTDGSGRREKRTGSA